jgi:crotonobetainyl-CoA:carnitine CoA-transferase CaiB-like acyl-CoA transferase
MAQQVTDLQRPAETALDGLIVLDATRVLAGPYCGMLLADLGADVIKIERPPGGDDTRAWGPPYLGDPSQGLSAYYLSVNRGKRSVCLDLKSRDGHDLFMAMVRKADVMVENFAPGVAERLGLGAESIAGANPRIVHGSITGFGDQAGPAYDLVIQGMSGLMSITGSADGPPMKVGVAITDVIAGLQAASAILAAIVARQRTGKGDRVSVSLMHSAVAALVNVGQAYLINGKQPRRWENAHAQIVPYQLFASADGFLTVAAGNDKLFGNLCQVVGAAEMASEERFRTNPQRVANRTTLTAILEPLFAEKSTNAWLELLVGAGVPCGPVSTLPELFGQTERRPGVEMLKLTTSTGETYETVGPAAKLNGQRREMKAAPLVGEHTEQVLRELLGLDGAQLEQLRADGVV